MKKEIIHTPCGKKVEDCTCDDAEVSCSDLNDGLKRLSGCLKELSAVLAVAEKDGSNRMLIANLEDAETYLQVAIGYLDD